MTVAVMQPYFLPYIGYFQLVEVADVFVVYDDVQYIKRGWVNRNRILVNGAPKWLTMPVQKGSSRADIIERTYVEGDEASESLANQVRGAYASAPHFDEVFPLLQEIMGHDERNVARFNEHGIRMIADRLGSTTRFVRSSELENDKSKAGATKVLEIVQLLGGTRYVNPIGGREIYSAEPFEEAGVDLQFLEARIEPYEQFEEDFVPGLSILDMLVFLGADGTAKRLDRFDLREPLGASVEDAP